MTINDFDLVTIVISTGFILLLSGGRDESSSELNTILSFNKTEESWQPAGKMTVGRYVHAVEVTEDVSKHCP